MGDSGLRDLPSSKPFLQVWSPRSLSAAPLAWFSSPACPGSVLAALAQE